MERIAFIIGETTIYWSSVMITMAAAAGICFFWALWLEKENSVVGAAAAVPLVLMLSLVLGRFVHWYCRADSYESFFYAMVDYSSGGYALLGAFAGCLLTAVILWALRIIDSIPRMLDNMSIAGSASIALGRLSGFFTVTDRGQILPETVGLPWAYPVTNPVSGVVECRLATFLLQAMVTGCISAVLAYLYLRERKNRAMKDGDMTLLFLLLYGAAQVVLDSTRYDSIYLRSNGFVSVVQILSAIAVALPIVLFSIRMVRENGFSKWYLAAWIVIAAMMGYAGYMEYYVQRHGNQAAFAYSNMSLCMAGVVIIAAVLWYLSIHRDRLHRWATIYPKTET